MITIENVEVFGWEAAIRGMRNPMNSWNKSDSIFYNLDNVSVEDRYKIGEFNIGENDLKLMGSLSKAGNDHAKFLRMINVTCDITAPMYWWLEYDTYKIGTVANSCSKMHKLLHKPFEMSDFSFDQLIGYKLDVSQFTPEADEDIEEWKPVSGNEDYFVSSEGRVSHNGRILSGSFHSDGYVFVTIHGKQCAKHRIVAESFVPNPNGKPFVNHLDGNKQNCSARNLEWCTQSENAQHAHDIGLHPKGLSTYHGKFTDEQREEIKHRWDSGEISKRQLAKEYGVSHTCICDIINDKYKYIEKVNVYESVARPIVDTLNELRDAWLITEDAGKKKQIWYTILQLLPESYNQRRTVQLNYQVLKSMWPNRHNHKLDEWVEFMKWAETLPYFKEICLPETESEVPNV